MARNAGDIVMNRQYLSMKYISELAHLWLKMGGSKKVDIAALEPMLWKDEEYNIIDVVAIFKDLGFHVSMTSNGAYLARFAQNLYSAGLDLLRISWHSMSDTNYKYITGGGKLSKLLVGLEEANKSGLNISINRVLMKGYTSDLYDQIKFIDQYKMRLKLLDLYWTPDSAQDYNRYYISPQDALSEFIHSGCIVPFSDDSHKHGRSRVKFQTVSGGVVEYKLQETVNRNSTVCQECNEKNNCLEGFGDYLRVFPDASVSLCYLRKDLSISILDEKNKIYFPRFFTNGYLSEFIHDIPLRLVLEGRCNFNCGFPDSKKSWCLKQGRGYFFPERKDVLTK
ncbi:radical SAM protein [Wohlfahrtiimonas chitiniclastica]|uniref:Radical SAM core domain-containing protein n=1 Tax=Wohlfahrtiimonas chitiniclastica SH04 TaxID=1261130 RepID=L8XXE0_9GAMM|nr:radical SAM protein [Wohlfahrtiimonas chitiniclastica]ELV08572.1 Hypothetical protein F387_01170 [Wohlfahrtiimonas chitiniclastica SH04]WHR55214.1 radical SAM protein [Wohlfahrtiimonas chitiniclastica]